MIVKTFPVGVFQCNCVILADPATREAIVVDPGDEIDRVLEVLRGERLTCKAILNTHAHIDHVGANLALRDVTGAPLMLHEADQPLYDRLAQQAQWLGGMLEPPPPCPVDEHIHQGDRIEAGGIAAEVLHTPGHTPGSLCFHVEGGAPLLLSGDTLFAGGIGRTDLWGGSYEQELHSIQSRLLLLDDHTRVIPGHGPETTIGDERLRNPFLAAF